MTKGPERTLGTGLQETKSQAPALRSLYLNRSKSTKNHRSKKTAQQVKVHIAKSNYQVSCLGHTHMEERIDSYKLPSERQWQMPGFLNNKEYDILTRTGVEERG